MPNLFESRIAAPSVPVVTRGTLPHSGKRAAVATSDSIAVDSSRRDTLVLMLEGLRRVIAPSAEHQSLVQCEPSLKSLHAELNAIAIDSGLSDIDKAYRSEHAILRQCQGASRHMTGGNLFLSYLREHHKGLHDASVIDFANWAFTPLSLGQGIGHLRNTRTLAEAKKVCQFASSVHYLPHDIALQIIEWKREPLSASAWQAEIRRIAFDANTTRDEKMQRFEIALFQQFQLLNVLDNRIAGGNGLLAYLKARGKNFMAVTDSDVEHWSRSRILRGRGVGTYPGLRAIDGARSFVALSRDARPLIEQALLYTPDKSMAEVTGVSDEIVERFNDAASLSRSDTASLHEPNEFHWGGGDTSQAVDASTSTSMNGWALPTGGNGYGKASDIRPFIGGSGYSHYNENQTSLSTNMSARSSLKDSEFAYVRIGMNDEFGHLLSGVNNEFGHLLSGVNNEFTHVLSHVNNEFGHMRSDVSDQSDYVHSDADREYSQEQNVADHLLKCDYESPMHDPTTHELDYEAIFERYISSDIE